MILKGKTAKNAIADTPMRERGGRREERGEGETHPVGDWKKMGGRGEEVVVVIV